MLKICNSVLFPRNATQTQVLHLRVFFPVQMLTRKSFFSASSMRDTERLQNIRKKILSDPHTKRGVFFLMKYSYLDFKTQPENWNHKTPGLGLGFLLGCLGFFCCLVFFGGGVCGPVCVIFKFTRLKCVEIAVLSVTIWSAQHALLLKTAFSVTANTAQNIPEQCQASLISTRVHQVKNPSYI